MKLNPATLRFSWLTTAAACLLLLAASGAAAEVLVDDTWLDGQRLKQKLPQHSAWYVSSDKWISAKANALTLAVGDGSMMALTYFTTSPDQPVKLQEGEELIATFKLTLGGVASENSSQGFRIGLFNFADGTSSPKRVSSDGFSSGARGDGVQGYALFQSMGTKFHNDKPMDIRKRMRLDSGALLAATGDYQSLLRDHISISQFPGFKDNTPYVLRLALKRTGPQAMNIDMSWSNTVTRATLGTSFTDLKAANFSFDGVAVRPSGSGLSATNIVLQQFKVERVPKR